MKRNRILSLILSVMMLFGIIAPSAGFAEEFDYQEFIIPEDEAFGGEDFFEIEEYDEDFDNEFLPEEEIWLFESEDVSYQEEAFLEDGWIDDGLSDSFTVTEEMLEEVMTEAESVQESFSESDLLEIENGDTFASVVCEIVEQPQDWQVTTVGEEASFTVVATGAASYQWEYYGATKKWQNLNIASAKEATLKIAATQTRIDTTTFRCTITFTDGTQATTDVVKMNDPSIVVDGVKYVVITDTNNVYIDSFSGSATSLIIPTTVEGYTVTEIGEEAFMDKNIVSISLPNTITIIHARAFKNCTSLLTMTNHD